MKMKQLSLDDFTAKTASDSPSPGGGSIAALTGSLAASLASMVAALTVNKSGYEEHKAEMAEMLEKCEQLRSLLLDDIDRDCVSFDGYIEALALPKDTDDQKAARKIRGLPLLASRDRIYWATGCTVTELSKVKPSTKQILYIQFQEGEHDGERTDDGSGY